MQCKRRTRRGGYCWAHMESNLNVQIKPSTIPHAGFGVFAAKKSFEKGQNIVPYKGKIKPLNGGDYTLQINRKQMVDAAKSKKERPQGTTKRSPVRNWPNTKSNQTNG